MMKGLSILFACFALGLLGSAFAQNVHDPNYTASVEHASLLNPMGVSVDASGRVFVADSGRGRILRGSSGVYAQVVGGFAVTPYAGYSIGPLSVLIAPNQTLLVGEGGRPTGVEQVFQYDLDGGLIRAFAPVPLGGNWYGLATNPLNGNLYATSANTDMLYQATPNGQTWSDFTLLSDLSLTTLVSPTGIATDGARICVSTFGSFGSTTNIATFDPATGALLNDSFSVGFSGSTGLALMPGGDLLAAEFGDFFGPASGRLFRVDDTTGAKTLLVDGIGRATSVAVGPDGSIFFTEIRTQNGEDGRLLRLTPVPEPATIAAMGVGLVFLRRRRR